MNGEWQNVLRRRRTIYSIAKFRRSAAPVPIVCAAVAASDGMRQSEAEEGKEKLYVKQEEHF